MRVGNVGNGAAVGTPVFQSSADVIFTADCARVVRLVRRVSQTIFSIFLATEGWVFEIYMYIFFLLIFVKTVSFLLRKDGCLKYYCLFFLLLIFAKNSVFSAKDGWVFEMLFFSFYICKNRVSCQGK